MALAGKEWKMNATPVIAAIVKAKCIFTPDMDASMILREAIAKARIHCIFHNPDASQTFDIAMAVAYTAMKEPDQVRLKTTLDHIKALNAAISGVPVDVEEVARRSEGTESLPVLELWHKAREKP